MILFWQLAICKQRRYGKYVHSYCCIINYYFSTAFRFDHLAVDCGDLSAPLNGSLQGSLTTFPNVVTFSCDEGFIREGSASRMCQANGSWSGMNTFCRGVYICLNICLVVSIFNMSCGFNIITPFFKVPYTSTLKNKTA